MAAVSMDKLFLFESKWEGNYALLLTTVEANRKGQASTSVATTLWNGGGQDPCRGHTWA